MDWLVVSEHAAERWHQRTDAPGIGPLVAWNAAERRDVDGLHGDEIRFHRATKTFLIQKSGVLVTVVDVATARPSIRASVPAVTD